LPKKKWEMAHFEVSWLQHFMISDEHFRHSLVDIKKTWREEVLEPNPSVAVMVHYEVRVGWLWVCEHPDFGYEWKTYQEPQSLVTSKIKSAISHPNSDIFEFPRFDSASSGQKIDPPTWTLRI
jgi:hypothetical protein